MPELAFFSHRFSSEMTPPQTYDHITAAVVPYFAAHGYRVASTNPEGIRLACEYRKSWVIPICVLLFPIGLLALLAEKRRHDITVSLRPNGAGTEVFFAGEAPPHLRAAIEALDEAG